MIERNYNIHDIVRFKIIDERNFLTKIFNTIGEEYKNFESEKEIDNLDFIIYIGKFIPDNQHCHILDETYYIKEDYLYCKGDSYKLAKWKFELSGFESDATIVRISNNIFANVVITGAVIDFLIRYKMNEKGYPFVHASCISKDGRALLFPAQSGTGKTTTALYFIEKGFDFLSDNFSILHDGQVISFLSPLNLFTYNITPMMMKSFKLEDKISLSLRRLLYIVTFGYIKLFMKVNAKSVFQGNIAEKSKLESVFLLMSRDAQQRGIQMENISRDELINHLITNMKLEAIPFLKYMMEYAYMFPESAMANHWTKYENHFRSAIYENIPIYKIELPRKYGKDVFEEIMGVIRSETNIEL
jgi:hypothetical protein